MTIDLSPLYQAIIIGAAGIVTLVFAAVGMALRAWIAKKTGLTEAQISEVNSSIYNVRLLKGISYAETILGVDASKLKEANLKDFTLKAAEYVKDNWPDMVKDQNLTAGDIAKHVIARLPSETSIRADAAQTAAGGGSAVPLVVPSPKAKP